MCSEIITSNLFPLEVVQKCQHCQLCALWENSNRDTSTEVSQLKLIIIHTITNRVLFSLEGNAFLDRFVRHELHSFNTTDGNPRL